MAYWDHVHHHTDTSEIWMAHPLVRAAINRRVGGDPNEWPVAALARRLRDRLPVGNGLSIGCGTGGLERSLVDEGVVTEMTGIDASEAALEEARHSVASRKISYVKGDARAFLDGAKYDAIFFHQSLHHFDDLHELMARVAAAIRPGGFLYLDEYVGPSRHEWSALNLLGPNLVYRMLPRGTRRAKIVRAPINREDPTEAVRSSAIIPAVEEHFSIVDRRDYGGNLLALLYPNMRRDASRFAEAIAQLIATEDRMLANGDHSFYSVIIAEPHGSAAGR